MCREDAYGSVTVTSIEPMSSCATSVPGTYVIVSVVSSDATRSTMAMSPAAELITRERVRDAEVTVKLAVAFELAEVEM